MKTAFAPEEIAKVRATVEPLPLTLGFTVVLGIALVVFLGIIGIFL